MRDEQALTKKHIKYDAKQNEKRIYLSGKVHREYGITVDGRADDKQERALKHSYNGE